MIRIVGRMSNKSTRNGKRFYCPVYRGRLKFKGFGHAPVYSYGSDYLIFEDDEGTKFYSKAETFVDFLKEGELHIVNGWFDGIFKLKNSTHGIVPMTEEDNYVKPDVLDLYISELMNVDKNFVPKHQRRMNANL